MVRLRVVWYWKRYMRKNRYHYKRYFLPLPKAIGDLLDARVEYVKITVTGHLQNNTAGDGAQVKLYYGTAPAPAWNAALTGTQKGQPRLIDYFPTAAKRFPFGEISTGIGGLTVGTQYWFDLALAAITGGTATVTEIEVVIIEL